MVFNKEISLWISGGELCLISDVMFLFAGWWA